MAQTKVNAKACLFDMDGLLLNTEDMYTEATNQLLARYGKGPLPWSVKIDLQGRPGPQAAARLLEWAKIDISPEDLFAETSKIQTKLWPEAKFLPGALELLQYLKQRNVPIALATSSMHDKYLLKTAKHRSGFDLFGIHVVTGDDKRVLPGRGKPAPDIWLVALESLNADRRASNEPEIKPEEALVFEDGIPGVQGAFAAGCPVIYVPHPEAAALLGPEKVQEVVRPGRGEVCKSLAEFKPAEYGL